MGAGQATERAYTANDQGLGLHVATVGAWQAADGQDGIGPEHRALALSLDRCYSSRVSYL